MEKYCKQCGRVFKKSDFKICPYCGNQLSTRAGRQHIPRKLRHQVFQRDGYRCRECGATNKQTRLHVDHIKPVAKGGTNDLNNLQTLCEECNKAKYTDEWVGGENNPDSYLNSGRIKKCPYCFTVINRKAKKCIKCGKQFNKSHNINMDNKLKEKPSDINLDKYYSNHSSKKHDGLYELNRKQREINLNKHNVHNKLKEKYKESNSNNHYIEADFKDRKNNNVNNIKKNVPTKNLYLTPKEIRTRYKSLDEKFRAEYKTVSIPVLLDYAGVYYKEIIKGKLYKINVELYD